MKHKGSFKPGNNANPNGRPKGTGTRQQFFRQMIAPHKDTLIDKALEMASGGNEAMLRLLLERLLPPKYQEIPLDIKGNTLKETTDKLLDNVAHGEITPDEASKIASLVQKDAEISNQQVMIEKLSKLEATMAADAKADITLEVKDGQKVHSGSDQS